LKVEVRRLEPVLLSCNFFGACRIIQVAEEENKSLRLARHRRTSMHLGLLRGGIQKNPACRRESWGQPLLTAWFFGFRVLSTQAFFANNYSFNCRPSGPFRCGTVNEQPPLSFQRER
jgi:hypothetical protein